MRTVQRSIRLDDTIAIYVKQLPNGSVNSLMNDLLLRFFTDKELRDSIVLKDARFTNWEPEPLQNIMVPLSSQMVIQVENQNSKQKDLLTPPSEVPAQFSRELPTTPESPSGSNEKITDEAPPYEETAFVNVDEIL